MSWVAVAPNAAALSRREATGSLTTSSPAPKRRAHGTSSDHQHPVVGADASRNHSVQPNGKRLDERAVIPQVGRQCDCGGGSDAHILGEGAGTGAETEQLNFLTVGGVVAEAPPTPATGFERHRRHGLS